MSFAVTNPRCLVRGSSRRMKTVRYVFDQPSNISLITVESIALGRSISASSATQ